MCITSDFRAASATRHAAAEFCSKEYGSGIELLISSHAGSRYPLSIRRLVDEIEQLQLKFSLFVQDWDQGEFV